jgi:hypothetical protein
VDEVKEMKKIDNELLGDNSHLESVVDSQEFFNKKKKRNFDKGIQEMIIPIFNVIQLLKLMTLCCEGKSQTAEQRAKDSVLSFKVAQSII